MEQELIELLLVAKKALSTGQAICAQADKLVQESDHHAEIMEKTWPKILFVNNHILVQISTLERIREFLVVKTEEVRNCINDREKTLAKVTLDLQNVFEVMKTEKIDPDILLVNQELRLMDAASGSMLDMERRSMSTVKGKQATLFEYIDDQAVLDLQRQADDEISEIESLCSSLVALTNSVSATIAELAMMQENALTISLDEQASAFANEKAQIQEEGISKMAEILTSLTNHYDQLGEATRLCQANPDAHEHLDITVLRNDHHHIPDILDDLQDTLEIVESVSEEIRVRMQVYLSVYDELVKILEILDEMGSPGNQTDIICERMMSAEAEMKEHEHSIGNLFKELSSLVDWYRVYAASYSHLILEIERRKQAYQKQQAMYKELMANFQKAYEEELQERHQWFKQHGEYLPEDLCRFMMNPPPRLSVELIKESGRLPDVSNAAIEKARSEVNRRPS